MKKIVKHINARASKNYKKLTGWQWENEKTGLVKLIFDDGEGSFIIDMNSTKNACILTDMCDLVGIGY